MNDALIYDFECDLEPTTHFPRVRFNFRNGWSASVLIRTDSVHALQASVAACPTKQWGTGKTQLGPTEASADEVGAWLKGISEREAYNP